MGRTLPSFRTRDEGSAIESPRVDRLAVGDGDALASVEFENAGVELFVDDRSRGTEILAWNRRGGRGGGLVGQAPFEDREVENVGLALGADRTRGGNFEETFRRLGGEALIAVDRRNERSICFSWGEAVDVDIGVRRNRTFVILSVKVLGVVIF